MKLFIPLILDKLFRCEYCPLEFQSRHERIQHTATHFKSKSCETCHKVLLCINGDWYELHVSPGCIADNGSEHRTNRTCTDTNETKTEAFDFETDLKLKSEESDHDHSDNANEDYGTIDSPSVPVAEIEVKALPPIVQSLAELKTNLTIKRTTRTKTQKSPDISTQDISHWKVRKVIKSPVTQQIKQIKHIKRISSQKVFMDHRPQGSCICDICKKTLASFTTLRHHILHQHSSSKQRLSCNECDQTFSNMGNLKKHKKLHLDYKAYVCSYCGKGFNQLEGLNEHLNHHLNVKPHKCPYCEKSFFRKSTRTKHIRVHTGVKPYKVKYDWVNYC